MKALLIVDLQNDFLKGGALEVSHGDEIIPLINRLSSEFSIVVATKDWHPKNHVSFANVHGKNPGDTLELGGVSQRLWKGHCVQKTQGSEFPKAFCQDYLSKIIYKGENPLVDSYSAFFDNQKLARTELEIYLKKMDVSKIYLAGLALDYCVKYSALDAKSLGFDTYVIQDA
ncbi:MAG: bifunctional nicotinamidase/pyrazinamidase, partial [Simkaniaceae bacterium]|nr:bifunctional nicotinamidase/pyrazinamidase [Simkaniaceae bacterium]